MRVTDPESGEVVWLGGVADAMKYVSPEIAKAVPVIQTVVGPSTDLFEISKGVNGSAARYGLFGSANDLDILAQLIIKVQSGDVEQLFDPRSTATQKVAQYLKGHVEKVLQENPSYRFIELKAGEYLDPETNEIQGIKWWLEDLRRGYKTVIEAKGTRRVSLAQAIAEPARIKIDWAIPSPLDRLNEFDYTEVTTIYTLGMKVGNNQARLRISDLPGMNESLLIKATSINVSLEDLVKSIELSIGESPTTLEHVHQGLIKTIEKYSGIDRLKVLKRLSALLGFWEGPLDFSLATGESIRPNELLSQVYEVLSKERIRTLSRIRSRADVRAVAKAHGVSLGTTDEQWLTAIRRDYPELKSANFEDLDRELADLVERELTVEFAKYPAVPQYIEFVRKRAPYVVGRELSANPVFLTLKPDAKFRAELAKKIAVWKEKYPLLKFTDPDDAHMTLHFAGRMSEPAMDAWIGHARARFSSLPEIADGGFHIMGARNNVIAIKFPVRSDLSDAIKNLRLFGTSVGANPEKRFLEFTPHITVATIADGGEAARSQVRRFVSEVAGTLSNARFDAVEIWTNQPKTEGVEAGRRYLKLR